MFKHKFDKNLKIFNEKLNSIYENTRIVEATSYIGTIKSTYGVVVTAYLPKAKIGDLCRIVDHNIELEIYAEVISISQEEVRLLPFGSIESLSNLALVYKESENFRIKISDKMLGSIVDGLGNISSSMLDENADLNNSLDSKNNYKYYSIMQKAPDPMKRKLITDPLITGVRSIDSFITCAKGQRLAIFAGPGMGKTTLMSMIIKNSQVDVIVVALIGERGREVREFIELDLNEDTRKKTVVVSVTSDRPPVEQVKGAFVAQTIAEYFRDQGKNVILFVDSITRFARAQREVGLSAGEPITRGGFPPSVFLSFPKLMERAGNSDQGSITAFYTVLMEGDITSNDPIADEVRSIVDGHIILTRKLAEQGHFPAINVLTSLSRIADRIITEKHLQDARKLRLLLSKYEELEFLIRVGEYKEGNDKLADEAISKYKKIMQFLQQRINDKIDFETSLKQISDLAK
jgi:type III secretion protein N (ATPase)